MYFFCATSIGLTSRFEREVLCVLFRFLSCVDLSIFPITFRPVFCRLVWHARSEDQPASMISSVSSRALLPNLGRIHTARQFSSVAPPNGSQNKQTKKNSESSNAKRELHNSAHSKADALKAAVENPPFIPASSGLAKRFVATAEVTVSKIFPAGFGWQTSSIIAENHLGYAADSAAFALTTGLGDAVGVLAGHTAYYAAKKATVDSSIDMEREAHVGVLLGSAAFCSGTAWQPLVDALQGAELSFMQVRLLCCGQHQGFGSRSILCESCDLSVVSYRRACLQSFFHLSLISHMTRYLPELGLVAVPPSTLAFAPPERSSPVPSSTSKSQLTRTARPI